MLQQVFNYQLLEQHFTPTLNVVNVKALRKQFLYTITTPPPLLADYFCKSSMIRSLCSAILRIILPNS